jgi:hypothetical protein
VLADLLRDQSQGEPGPDERDVGTLTQQVRHSADVVFVSVRENQADDVVQPIRDRVQAGQDEIDPRVVVILGEQHAAVDQQQLARDLQNRHVAADVTQAAQRNDPQRLLGISAGTRCVRGCHGRQATQPLRRPNSRP